MYIEKPYIFRCIEKPKPKFTLTLSQRSPGFMCLQYKSFQNTEGKGEIAHNKKFLLFPLCFLLIWINLCCFPKILKLSSADFFSLEESKICHLGKG